MKRSAMLFKKIEVNPYGEQLGMAQALYYMTSNSHITLKWQHILISSIISRKGTLTDKNSCLLS